MVCSCYNLSPPASASILLVPSNKLPDLQGFGNLAGLSSSRVAKIKLPTHLVVEPKIICS